MGINKQIVIFGFGAQGKAQTLNLRDSGLNVGVCLSPESKRIKEVEASELPLFTNFKEAATQAKVASLLVSDCAQPQIYSDHLARGLPKNAALIFAHGFAIHYKQIIPRPDLDVILVAPLAQGEIVRSDYKTGCGVPCVIAIAQDATGEAKKIATSYARAISPAGKLIESTFAEEVESDIFVEQALLCGGMPELVRASFEALVKAGYNEDIAYFCCLKELRPIVNLMDAHSIAGMRAQISDTALYGALTRGRRIIDEHVRANLDSILHEIRSGQFAKEIIDNPEQTKKTITDGVAIDKSHLIESLHTKLSKKG